MAERYLQLAVQKLNASSQNSPEMQHMAKVHRRMVSSEHIYTRKRNAKMVSMIFCNRRLLHSLLGHCGLGGCNALSWCGTVCLDMVGLGESSLSVLLSVLLSQGFGSLMLGGSLVGLDLIKG